MTLTAWNRRAGLLFIMAVLCLTGSAFAVVVVQDATETISGVDSSGSPSIDNAGTGTGKIYKDTNTGILFEAVSGIVINESYKKKTTFRNQGVSVTDPGSNQTFTATKDLEVVYRAFSIGGFARAGQLALFIPPAS